MFSVKQQPQAIEVAFFNTENQKKMLVTTVLIIGGLVGFAILFKSIDWFEKI